MSGPSKATFQVADSTLAMLGRGFSGPGYWDTLHIISRLSRGSDLWFSAKLQIVMCIVLAVRRNVEVGFAIICLGGPTIWVSKGKDVGQQDPQIDLSVDPIFGPSFLLAKGWSVALAARSDR